MVKTTSKKGVVPGWAKRIAKVRSSLGMTQSEFGQELQYSAMAISRWERGIQAPPAEAYIKIGKLSAAQDRWFFWESAGLSKKDIQNEMPQKSSISHFEVVIAGSATKKSVAKKAKLVAIPLLQIRAGSHGEEGDNVLDLNGAPREELLDAPVAWCPHPDSTSCLRVKGKSMTPLIYNGDILAVDSSQTKHSELNDKIVVAWHKKRGLSVSRFRHVDGVELLESDNRDYEPITLSTDRNWRVLGRVLWLIRQTP